MASACLSVCLLTRVSQIVTGGMLGIETCKSCNLACIYILCANGY